MVEPSGASDDNVTDIVVAGQAGLALVRVQEPIKDVVDKLRRETTGATSRRAKKAAGTSAKLTPTASTAASSVHQTTDTRAPRLPCDTNR